MLIFLMAFSFFPQLILMEALNCARRYTSDENDFLPCTCYHYITRYKYSCLILLLKCKILRCKFFVPQHSRGATNMAYFIFCLILLNYLCIFYLFIRLADALRTFLIPNSNILHISPLKDIFLSK